MPIYRITYSERAYYTCEVEADTPEEAEDKFDHGCGATEIYNIESVDHRDENGTNVEDVELIAENWSD